MGAYQTLDPLDEIANTILLMNDAYLRTPERFTHGASIVAAPPAKVWLNPPTKEVATLPDSIP